MSATNEKPMRTAPQQQNPDMDLERGCCATNAEYLHTEPELPPRPEEEDLERAAPADAQQPVHASATIENASLLVPRPARTCSPFHRVYWQRHTWRRHIHWYCSTPFFVYFSLICWMASLLIWIGLTIHNLVLYFQEQDPYPRYLRLGWLMAQLMVCYLLVLQCIAAAITLVRSRRERQHTIIETA